ncbi:hypothetical protein [Neglectibacter timonensis]|uniref:hypothetical protein n=1 Tax=Neglectibacter timonensis TaxID=1776382 RepID=UPI0039A35245
MSWDKERSRRYSFLIRQTMIRTLVCSWKGAAYTQERDLQLCFQMANEITLEVAWS